MRTTPLRSSHSLLIFDSKICLHSPLYSPATTTAPLGGVGYTGKRLRTPTTHPLQHLEAY